MTKSFHTPILVDEPTAAFVREHIPVNQARVRRIATVRPRGMDKSVQVSELVPPASELPELTNDAIVTYENALEAFDNRDWEQAFSLLHQVPANDRVKDFLTVFIAQNNRVPPTDWDGTIPTDRFQRDGERI